MSTVLNSISKKVGKLALTLTQTTVGKGSACPCQVERGTQEGSTLHWPMYPLSQIAFLTSTADRGAAPQHGDGWQEEAAGEAEARLSPSRSESKLHLASQAYLSLTHCLASLQNHSGWEPNILNPGGSLSVFHPAPYVVTPS